MNETFMKEKPVLPLLISMSLPMVISMLVNSLYNIVDSFFVAKISEDAMTALSLVYPVQNFINAVAIGFGVGINAVIAYHLGAGEPKKANAAATWGFVLSMIHGAVLLVGSIVIIPTFLRMFTSDAQVIDYGIRYARIAFAFSLVIAASLAFEKIFQSVGRMKVTMGGMLAGCVTNIILDPVLIFGIGPFTAMSIEGAALATGIGQVLTVVIYLVIYLARPLPVWIGRKYLIRETGLFRRLYSIGIPATLNLALPSLLISALNGILAMYGQIYVVILGIYYKLQTFLYLPVNGIVQGMRPIIGYNYGAKEHKRVKQIYRIALAISAAIMLAGTVVCLVAPGQLIGIYTTNPETISAGKTALRLISAGFIVSAVSVASSGALEGLGKGVPSFIISLFRYVVIIIPAAFLLSRIFGAVGVWNAFWIAETITAVIAFVIYRRALRGGTGNL
ncbi:MAG TPA: MATE family efflux transporter [Candidatus Anaerobutyricum avicola]|nr:MATE family efflux transporter [Candidatus Anaerobutyricum avicola]